MWPLSGKAVAEACGVDASPSSTIAGVSLGWEAPAADEVYVALREGGRDGHEDVVAALEVGAPLAVVASDWPGLADLSPEHRARCLVVPDPLRALRSLAARMRKTFRFPVVAVAGSVGKTTTKDLLAALLGERATRTPETMNGWSGLPATLLQRAHAEAAPPDALVVEIGIDAPGAMDEHARLADPDVAVITAVGAEHLAGLGSAEEASREEWRLFEVASRARRVYHAEDPWIRERLATARAGDVIVSAMDRMPTTPGVAVLGYDVKTPTRDPAEPCEVELAWRPALARAIAWRTTLHLPMAGRHNGGNLALAAAAAIALGRSPEELAHGLASFEPPTMRCAIEPLADGTLLVDDAYNASPASVRAALDLLAAPAWADRPKVVVLGDMLDLGDAAEEEHRALLPALTALRGARIVLFGTAMSALRDALAREGIAAPHTGPDEDPRALLDFPLAGSVVLVKGSRGMHLERVTSEIRRRGKGEIAPDVELAHYRGRFASVCVTGTNGKTTTTSLVAAIVEAAGEVTGRVTTLGAWVGGERTGDDPTGGAFLRTLARAAERGVRTLAIETTSHALSEGFGWGWPPTVAVFTNLSRDHLDYHGTPERYLAAKAQLFMALSEGGAAVLNVADPSSALLDEVTPQGVRRLGYTAREPAPECAAIPVLLRAASITIDEHGTHAVLAPSPLADALGGRIDLSLVGSMHVENALAAACAAHALGYDAEVIGAGLASFAGVPGRFQIVHRRPLLVVDFAHTPDALARTLSLARSLVAGRVLCVFGCGGDRDPGKRGTMGAIAAEGADVVVITTDNPRSEDPDAIADAVEEGAKGGRAKVLRIPDRARAIGSAVELATEGDIVVIAGKGHETTQIVGDRVIPFDDVEVARDAAARKGVSG